MVANDGSHPATIQSLVRDLIVSSRIAPGEPIRQDRVAKALGISKIPLREALARLEEAGLVESTLHRGYIASRLSRLEADDLFSTRILIEPPTAGLASELANDEERETVSATLTLLKAPQAEASHTAPSRLKIILDLLRPARRPTVEKLVVPLFYRSERYLPRTEAASLDRGSLEDLVSAWSLERPAAVRELYEKRLMARWKTALENLAPA